MSTGARKGIVDYDRRDYADAGKEISILSNGLLLDMN
jgi:hypothetical protein